MLRLFETHRIRKQKELSHSFWDFTAETKEGTVHKKVMVPSCWENDPETLKLRGKGWYERRVYAGGSLRLELKGVSHTAAVFWDGEEIARHYNAYTPFSAVMKDVKEGYHTLRVCVDNSFGPDSALHVENDYQSYGGISRGVAMEELGKAWIRQMHISTRREDGGWQVKVEAAVENLLDQSFTGRMRLYLAAVGEEERIPVNNINGDGALAGNLSVASCAQTEIDVLPSESTAVECSFSCGDVQVWDPETPNLYVLSAVLEDEAGRPVDDLIDRFGFREVEVNGKDILLNGRKLKIRGFCRHEDHPQFGCSLPVEAMQQDLLLMKDLGANSVRTSHYPNDEIFLDLCDELGFLVWEENHARGLSEEAMRNPNFERQCEDCIHEMIQAHYNHPSIYIWGILNECASHTEYGRKCYAAQFELIRKLDQTRPCSFASCQFKTDICFDLPDVVSYNIYPLWYHDTPPAEYLDGLYRWVQEETGGAGKPFLITEVGAGGIYGYRTPSRVKWSEEYQAEALEQQLTAILSDENVSGVYVWQFCDCRVCGSWFGGRPRTMNNKGIVDEYRRPKLAYETVKKIFTSM